MKIGIRHFWNRETWGSTTFSTIQVLPEEVLKNIGFITICDITIDNQKKGEVRWDGKKLSVHKSSPLPEGAFS